MNGILIGTILSVGFCIGFIGGALWASVPRDDDDDIDWGGYT